MLQNKQTNSRLFVYFAAFADTIAIRDPGSLHLHRRERHVRVDAEKFPGAVGPLDGTKLFLQPPKFSPASSREDASRNATGLKRYEPFNPDAQRPKSLRSGERAAPVRNRDGRGEPIQRRVSAGGAGSKADLAPVLLQRASRNETVALRPGSAGRTGKHEAGGLKIQTFADAPRRRPEVRSLLQPRSFQIRLLLQSWTPLLCLPTPPSSHDKQVNSHTRTRAAIHLLFSRLAVGGDHGSFTFGVHAGFCFKTFAPLNTCQRKQPGKRSISIATPLVFFLPPSPPPSSPPPPPLPLPPLPPSLSLSLFLHLQHWPQIRHSFCWGDLKPSAVGFFFSLSPPQPLFRRPPSPPSVVRTVGAP